jgi:hypothetical protein
MLAVVAFSVEGGQSMPRSARSNILSCLNLMYSLTDEFLWVRPKQSTCSKAQQR